MSTATKVLVTAFEKKTKEIVVTFPVFHRDSDIFDESGTEYDRFEKLEQDLSFVSIIRLKKRDNGLEYEFECGQYSPTEKNEDFFKGNSNEAEFREALIELQEKLKSV